ncbi:unnamed protein product [Spirodela intermedia]|uniref:Uncharacterized protein n=1 Tax=Spirodela intermedia TaxID=51605 RepID=A0A7I8KLX5_SPIIN|nr:unnamed protein product [Spirodela intermedia]
MTPASIPTQAEGSLFVCCSSETLGDALTCFHSMRSNGRLRAPRSEIPGPNGKKVANLSAKHKESIKLPEYTDGNGKSFPISEFINHPSGVESILNTRALQSIERLETSTYRCTLPTINFLNFEVVPVIVLRVTSTSDDCMVEMLSCKFEGSQILEQQSHRFSAAMRNHITWGEDSVEPSLSFDVNLSVALEVYTKPFTLLPVSAVETPGNLIMQGLIDRLVPQLVEQLLEDYRSWVEERVNVC